ncbi:MFS transporter [Micromonospora purpureochromogenes]|uniref:MFS transporter n=1 Tax=Micromonospora purpureochromogenes TaxID=47872 RepID=UPI0033C6CE9D
MMFMASWTPIALALKTSLRFEKLSMSTTVASPPWVGRPCAPSRRIMVSSCPSPIERSSRRSPTVHHGRPARRARQDVADGQRTYPSGLSKPRDHAVAVSPLPATQMITICGWCASFNEMVVTTGGPVASGTLWRNRGFNAFWASQILSVLGDSFSHLAVPLLVLDATGSIATAGLLTGVAGTTAVVAGLFAGVVVDRMNRRMLLIGSDLARMLLFAVIPIVWLTPEPPIWLLFVLLPLASAIGMVFQVAAVTATRSLVAGAGLTLANGRLFAGTALASVVGPALAGAVSGWIGPAGAIAVDAASFGLSAAFLLLVRLPARAAASPDAAPHRRTRPWDEWLAGARFLLRHPVLRPLTALLTAFILLTYGIDDVVIYHLRHDLDQPDGTIGLVLTAGAAGTLTGSLIVARLRSRLGFGTCWIGSVALSGVAIATLSLTGRVVEVGALMAAYFCCVSIGGICSLSLRQEVTPEHLLGRVTSAFWTIHFSLGGLGAAALTWLAQHRGTQVTFALAGAGCLAVAATALSTPVRRDHRTGRRPGSHRAPVPPGDDAAKGQA